MDIGITMLGNPSTVLTVDPQDTVGRLKRIIQEKMDVVPQRQRLVINNGQKTPLNDDSRSLSHYGLRSGSQVSLLITEPADIQVFLRNEKGQTITYDIKPDETVADFKAKVEHRQGVAVSQLRLIHQGREMTSGTLADYDVKALSTIYMNMRLRGG